MLESDSSSILSSLFNSYRNHSPSRISSGKYASPARRSSGKYPAPAGKYMSPSRIRPSNYLSTQRMRPSSYVSSPRISSRNLMSPRMRPSNYVSPPRVSAGKYASPARISSGKYMSQPRMRPSNYVSPPRMSSGKLMSPKMRHSNYVSLPRTSLEKPFNQGNTTWEGLGLYDYTPRTSKWQSSTTMSPQRIREIIIRDFGHSPFNRRQSPSKRMGPSMSLGSPRMKPVNMSSGTYPCGRPTRSSTRCGIVCRTCNGTADRGFYCSKCLPTHRLSSY